MANPNMANSVRKLLLLRILLIVAAACWVFSPSLSGDWLMDDDFYLPQNALVNDPHRLWKTWFAPGSLMEYYPIEASVQAVQWHFWHLNTLGYHLTNLVLHIVGSLLVWRLLARFGLRLAWLGGFLFAIHPANVESVAWISELKNTLSLPPFLLAMCAWIDFQRLGRSRDYYLALGFFFIAMLCKISMALFPLVILLHAWWLRGRIGWKDVIVAVPFFAISIALGALTVLAGNWFRVVHQQPSGCPYIGDLFVHFALAGQSILFYFSKCVWPAEMTFIYPKWEIDPDSLMSYLPWLVIVGVICFLWNRRKTWGRHALLGLGFFLINLLPFVGLNSVSYMNFTWVMDHFLYIPLIGVIGLAIAALGQIDMRLPASRRGVLHGIIAVVLALLAWESQSYAKVFAGPEKLWAHTIDHNPTCWLAYNNLGDVMLETGRIPEAIELYGKALRFNPGMVEAHTNLGFAYFQSDRIPDAIAQYELALQANPHFYLAHLHLGNALARMGRVPEAINQYQEALQTNPYNDEVRNKLAELKALPETKE